LDFAPGVAAISLPEFHRARSSPTEEGDESIRKAGEPLPKQLHSYWQLLGISCPLFRRSRAAGLPPEAACGLLQHRLPGWPASGAFVETESRFAVAGD